MPGIPRALRESYLRAVYRVETSPSAIFLRIGETSPAIDLWLETVGKHDYAFLSAANPGSRQLSEDENRRRHVLLLERVAASGLPALAGESYEAASGGWREESLLVAGIERAAAVTLAREFGQVALLCGAAGAAVELVWTGEPGEASADRGGES